MINMSWAEAVLKLIVHFAVFVLISLLWFLFIRVVSFIFVSTFIRKNNMVCLNFDKKITLFKLAVFVISTVELRGFGRLDNQPLFGK